MGKVIYLDEYRKKKQAKKQKTDDEESIQDRLQNLLKMLTRDENKD